MRVPAEWSSRGLAAAAAGAAFLVLLAGCGAAHRAQPGPGAAAAVGSVAAAGEVVLDEMDRAALWQAAPASGVQLQLDGGPGIDGGRALRVDFDFRGGGGWAAFRRDLPVRLPENYEISFWIRGEAPVNTLEFKLIDASGENVWWVNRPRFDFAGDWRRVTFRRRHVEFAWGPAGGGEIRDVAAIEFAITAGTGGSGTVWIDRITLTPREPVEPYGGVPVVHASTGAAFAAAVVSGSGSAPWRSEAGGQQHVTLDFGRMREYGGLVITWADGERAADYDVEVSADGQDWRVVRQVRLGAGPRDYLALPETESRWLRLKLLRAAADRYAIRQLDVQPLEWGGSANTVFESIAADAPPGHYPKYFGRRQSYWTLIGAGGAADEALINEEGMVEVGKGAFSIEPFVHAGGHLSTWADAAIDQSLERGYLPVPTVRRGTGLLTLSVTGWADGPAHAPVLWLRYRVASRAAVPVSATLYLALRPFQVNPTWQFLNQPGGVSPVESMEYDGRLVHAQQRVVVPLTPASAFGAAAFDAGGILPWIAGDSLPPAMAVHDPAALASAALAYPLELPPGGAADVVLAVPMAPGPGAAALADSLLRDAAGGAAESAAEASLQRTLSLWREQLDRFDVVLPAGAPPLADMVRSNLAWVLINRDGPAIQPGSRSYERSWIRDGSLTSAALLRLGHAEVVREFIEWYAPFQYEDGKVPCCVDHRGADPVPEHDSHGQLIYVIAEYFRFTGDTALVERFWPSIAAAAGYIEELRRTRMTEAYHSPALRAYYGLVPESISHEGYSARPMHSYWDNFFVLRGLKDAAALASVLGHHGEARRLGALADEFRRDLLASFELAMASHDIDYLPGSVELGDFDATSTTVGIAPGGELHALPRAAVDATFERYWRNFVSRRDGTGEWNDYTPYELRVVGTFVQLGQRRRAHEALAWFLRDVRPRAWNHWAEVVWRDPADPRFIGDMPHGWVGSDFIRSVTDMFAFYREADGALVLGAGLLPEWLDGGEPVQVRGLRTYFGSVAYRVRRTGAAVEFLFDGAPVAPPGGIEVVSPLERAPRAAEADGRRVPVADGVVRLSRWPSRLVLHY
jgi:hypothetical protein